MHSGDGKAGAPEESRCAWPVAEDSEKERIYDTRVPRLHRDLGKEAVIGDFRIKTNLMKGFPFESRRGYLLLQCADYIGFRTTVSEESFEFHPPVTLPHLLDNKSAASDIFH